MALDKLKATPTKTATTNIRVPPAKVETQTNVSIDTRDLSRIVAQLAEQQNALIETLNRQGEILAKLAGREVAAPTVKLPRRARAYFVEMDYDEDMQRVEGMRVIVED
jgi:hypothetical protein